MNCALHSSDLPSIYVNEEKNTLSIEPIDDRDTVVMELGCLDGLIVKLMAARALLSPIRAIEQGRF